MLFEHNLNIAWMLFNFFSLVALLVPKYNFSLLLKWCSNATFLCCSSNVWVVFFGCLNVVHFFGYLGF